MMRIRLAALAVLIALLGARLFAQSCPTSPTLIGPTGNNVPRFVTLEWQNVGAERYDVYLGRASSGGCDQLIGTAHNGATTFNPPQLEPGVAYAWKVIAIKTGCPNVRSTCGQFLTQGECPTVAPTLVEPAMSSVVAAGDITFRWSSVPNASFYQLWGSIDGGAFQMVGQTPATDYHLGIGAGKQVEWYVRAIGLNCSAGTESARSRFTTSSATCARPALIAPAHQSTQTLPLTFEWNAVPNAISYDVMSGVTIGTNVPTSLGNTTNTRLVVNNLTSGTHNWWVRANFRDCPSTESDKRTFTLAASTCPVAPTVTAPAAGITTQNPVTFNWNAVNGASGYALMVSVNGGEFGVYGTTTETSIQRILPTNTPIQWYVAALAQRCDPAKSQTRSLTVSRVECPPASIAFSFPTGTGSTQTFNWSTVEGASAYRLWVSVDGGSRTLIAQTTSTQARIALPAGTIALQVEALRPNCPSVISQPLQLVVPASANCSTNPAPAIVAPNGTESAPTEVRHDVTFRWNAVTNAIGYRVWVARNDQPFDDIAFVRATEVTRELEAGRYRWFAEAIFEGCPGVRSAIAFFNVADDEPRCTATTPTILNPPADSVVTSSPVTFSWTAVPGALQYRVLVSLNGGPIAILGTTTDTELRRPIPPGQVTWAVEAVLDECPSTFSPRTTFTTRQSANCTNGSPSPLLPANGATVTSPVTFNWTPVTGAERYVVFVRVNNGVPTPIEETTENQTTRRLPPGRYEWFVAALFSGCPATQSPRSLFNIEALPACDNRAPVLLEPADASIVSTLPVQFLWTAVPNATQYKLYAQRGDDEPQLLATTTTPGAQVDVPAGFIRWRVEAEFGNNCPPTTSARGFFAATNTPQECRTPRRPRANVVGRALSGTEYAVRWSALPNVDSYELQESSSADFTNAATQIVRGQQAMFTHNVTTPTQFHYRVRGISNCSDERGPYSNVATVLVVPQSAVTQRHASAEFGTDDNIVQTITLPGQPTPQAFSATVDKPWLTIVPSSGTVGPNGVTLSVVADPDFLHLGTNTATINISYPNLSQGRLQTHATTVKLPVQISLVTPVTPAGKSSPPPDALIIPAVAHAEGALDSLFESDIRVTNLGAETMKYQITYTPSGVDGTTTGKTANVEVSPNQTLALDDVIASLFGSGTTTGTLGMLEIRPLTTNTSSAVLTAGAQLLSSVASSRTYNVTPTGTFGQFIPAIPFANFIGSGSVLSLQQIAQSADFRTNFGFAEASGNPVDLLIKVYDKNNALVKEIPESLGASQHKQINNMLAAHGITDLAEGRVTVEVTNGAGKVTAYASSVDNKTNDPLLVSPVVASQVSANRYVIPGAAYIDTGFAFWQTDLRVFNAGSSPVNATLTFHPQANSGPAVSKEMTLAAGEIKVLDNVVAREFGMANGAGGQIVVATADNTSIVATARTYNRTSIGTYGQFIPGVTPAESVGAGDRALQVLQLEHSSRFRTNVGLSETTGNPATVEVALITPETKATPILEFNLAANEFRQFSLADFGLGDTVYNARVTVKVISGTGKVTAYGSSIDATTQDPTYVPAQ